MRNETQDSPTAPLPILSQFFTWAPGEEPAPYDPPSTQRRPPLPSPAPDAIGTVRRAAPAKHTRHQRWLGAGVAAVTIAVATVLIWPQPTTTQRPDDVTPPTPTASDAPRLDARLAALLPPGYPPGACAALPTTHSTAECGANADAPATSGRYTVYPDSGALTDAFDRYVAETTVLVCPGGYQSPVLCPTGVSKTFWEVRR